MKTHILFITSILLITASCSYDKYNVTELKAPIIIGELNDSTFFKEVISIASDNSYIYAADAYNRRIIKFDENMNYIMSIGSKGEGPDNFVSLSNLRCVNDTLYINDYNGFKTVTTDGVFVSTTKMPHIEIDPYSFCMDQSNNVYVSSKVDSLPLVKYDIHMNYISTFGEWLGEDKNPAENLYLLDYFNDMILSIKRDEPVISLYNEDGVEIASQTISHDIFKSRLLFKKQQYQQNAMNKRRITHSLFMSVSSYQNRVFLLTIDHDNIDSWAKCNKIIELIFSNNHFSINNIYQLDKDSWYTCIHYRDGKLFCYSGTKEEFHIYNLQN